MVLKFSLSDQLTARGFIFGALATSDDDDAAACSPGSRLDDEFASIADEFAEPPHITAPANDRVGFRHRNTVLMADLLRKRLIINPRIECARVARLDER